MITKFSKQFMLNMVEAKVADPIKLRDYDILKDRERGLSNTQLAIKHSLSRQTIIDIIARYQK